MVLEETFRNRSVRTTNVFARRPPFIRDIERTKTTTRFPALIPFIGSPFFAIAAYIKPPFATRSLANIRLSPCFIHEP